MWPIADRGDHLEITVDHPRIERLDDFFAGVEASPGWRPGKPLLVIHGAGRFDAPYDQLRLLSSVMGRHLERLQTRMAIVIPGDLEFGEVRVIGAVMDTPDTLVLPFRDRASALQWLLAGKG